MNQIAALQTIAVFVLIGVGIIVPITILNLSPVDEIEEDFVRTITGLECHQMERYILDMEYQWDKVVEYHSFKCVDSTSDDYNIARGSDVNGEDVDDEDGNENGDVE